MTLRHGIKEIRRKDYPSVGPLVHNPDDMPEAQSVIRGVNPGWIFVDELPKPQAVLIWAKGIDGFYLAGDHMNMHFRIGLSDFINRIILPRALNSGLDRFELSCDRQEWDGLINTMFPDRDVEQSVQRVYKIRERAGYGRIPSSPCHASLSMISTLLRSDISLHNRSFLDTKLNKFWDSREAFLAAGLGYAAIVDGAIASLCFSAFVADGVHVVDIETTAQYRRQGYAKAAACAFITECKQKGLEPYWDCMEENMGSRRVAESIGFSLYREYTLYSFPLEYPAS